MVVVTGLKQNNYHLDRSRSRGSLRVSNGAGILGSVSSAEGELSIGDCLRRGGFERDTNNHLSDDAFAMQVFGDSRNCCCR